MTDDIEKACEVYWGEWVPVEDCDLQEKETPETILMAKDAMESMPKECRTLVEILLNLPEEMYLTNGKVKTTQLFRKIAKAQAGWSIEKARLTYFKLARHLSVSARSV
jgi:hypothetical protein